MPGSQEPLSITLPTYHQLLLRQVREATHCVKSFDPATRTLTIFYWPVEGEARVTPESLCEHRKSHRFLGPSCLCPLFVAGPFTEAAIVIATSGPFSGEYVARCAKNRCGYLVLLERIYPKPGVPARAYPVRGVGEAHPPPVLYDSEIEFKNQKPSSSRRSGRPLKRAYAQADLAERRVVARRSDPQPDWRLFQQLDAMTRPGLTQVQFRSLFTVCGVCGLVTTRQVFSFHQCRDRQSRARTDLTDVE